MGDETHKLDEKAAQFRETIHSMIDEDLTKLQENWFTIGMKEEELSARENNTMFHFKEMLKEMIKEEQTHKEVVLKRIERNARLYTKICTELGREPLAPPDDCKILEADRFFRHKLKEATTEKEEIMKEVRLMKSEEECLSMILGETPMLLPIDVIPSASSMAELKSRVDYLRTERHNRSKQFEKFRTDILKSIGAIDVKPTTEFEKEVMANNPDFILSVDRMAKVKKVHELYLSREERARTEARDLKTEITTLTHRLDLPDDKAFEIMEILESTVGCTGEDLKKLRRTLDELIVIKRREAGKLIERIAAELVRLHGELLFSDEQKNAFCPKEEDPEVMLKLYEDELERLTAFRDKTKAIYLKFEEHQKLWDRAQELEIRSMDSNRYNNRGGALLAEEKERKKLNREIPRVEESLQKLVDAYDAGNPYDPVLVYGQPVMDLVQRQRESYEEQKEREKQMRALLRSKQIEKEATLGARPMTPNRKRTGQPSFATPTKKLRLGSQSVMGSLKKDNSAKTLVPNAPAQARNLAESRQVTQGFLSAWSDDSYSDFKENLETKSRQDYRTRSSIASRRKSRSTPNLSRPVQSRTSPRRPLIRLGSASASTLPSTSMLLRSRLPTGNTPVSSKVVTKANTARRFHLS